MTRLEEAKRVMFDYIKGYDNVSFVELERVFNEKNLVDKVDTDDGRHISFDVLSNFDKNIILWRSRNRLIIDSFIELSKEKRIFAFPTTFWVYACDGGMLRLPIVRKAYHYKSEHWCPTVMSIHEAADESGPMER